MATDARGATGVAYTAGGGAIQSCAVPGAVAAPVVAYCDVQGGYSGSGTNNLAVDPDFTDTNLFQLASNSPLIDAGDPDPRMEDQAFPPSQGSSPATSFPLN